MLNKVMIIGRLGRDPELRYTQSGAPVCSMTVATDESYQDRDGNKVERTEWHRISVFQRAAENCANYLSKGSLVYVEGSLATRKYTDAQGIEKYATEIKAQRVQFLDRKGDRPAAGNAAQGGYADDDQYGGGSPRRAMPPRQQQGGYQPRAQQAAAPAARPAPVEEDLGPAFPSEASGIDEVPF